MARSPRVWEGHTTATHPSNSKKNKNCFPYLSPSFCRTTLRLRDLRWTDASKTLNQVSLCWFGFFLRVSLTRFCQETPTLSGLPSPDFVTGWSGLSSLYPLPTEKGLSGLSHSKFSVRDFDVQQGRYDFELIGVSLQARLVRGRNLRFSKFHST
jgi:hypothetical protein